MTIGDWTVKVTGEVVRVDREDVDKSGRNPRFLYTFIIKASAVDGVPAGAELGEEVSIRARDLDLDRLTKAPPGPGTRVTMTAKANGPKPRLLMLTAIG